MMVLFPTHLSILVYPFDPDPLVPQQVLHLNGLSEACVRDVRLNSVLDPSGASPELAKCFHTFSRIRIDIATAIVSMRTKSCQKNRRDMDIMQIEKISPEREVSSQLEVAPETSRRLIKCLSKKRALLLNMPN